MIGLSCAGTWWLLFIIAHLVRIAPPVYCQNANDSKLLFLLAIKSNQSGLEIRTFPLPENHGLVNCSGARLWPAHELKPQVQFIPDRRLSSGCGEQYFRCQELLVESYEVDSGTLSVVFVPLEDGVLVLFYKLNNSNSATLDWNTVTKNTTNCSPTVFYKISGRIYMVCISSHIALDIFVYGIQLNVSDSVIEESEILLLLAVNDIFSVTLTSNLSNFVVIKHRLFCAINDVIISIDVNDHDPDSTKHLAFKTCMQICSLLPTVDTQYGQILVAFCTDRIMYIHWGQNGGLNGVQRYSSSGSVTYVCPDNKYRATLFNGTILQFSLLPNYISANISRGICFKTRNGTYFAYTAQNHQNRVFVYDFVTQDINCVSYYDCPNTDCPQLLVLENQYLVVRDANHDFVLDATNNFSLVINISGGLADILTILHNNVNNAITPSPPVTGLNTTTAKLPPDVNRPTAVGPVQNNLSTVVSTVVTGLFIITLILVTAAIVFFIQRYRGTKWYSKMYKFQRLRFVMSKSRYLSPLAVDSDQDEDNHESNEVESHSHNGQDIAAMQAVSVCYAISGPAAEGFSDNVGETCSNN